MTLRLPTRALAPVIVLVVFAGIAATFMVYRTMPSGAESSLTLTPKPKPLARKPETKPATKPAAKTKPAATKPKAKVKTKAPAPKTKPAVSPATPAVKPVEAPKGDPVDANGLPLVLARALAKHPVTVVALYDPAAAIDEMALAEARAGAAEVGAGFLALSIRNEPQVRPLTQLHGVLESPSVLVYERPKTLFVRLTGFSDRETVAQAAANARR
jgi:outer membrane biosynthesis protein TonB